MDTVIRDALSGALSVSYSYHCFQMSRYQYMGEHMFSAMVYLLLRIPADAYQCFFHTTSSTPIVVIIFVNQLVI